MSLRNILLIVAVIILLASASAYTVFTIVGVPLGNRPLPTETVSPARSSTPGPVYNAGSMIVNLSGSNNASGRVVRAGVAFELDSEKTRRQLEQREEQVKDRILSIVRQQTLESVATNEGLDAMRGDLKQAIGALLHEGEVVNVYLFEWVVP